MLYSHVFSQDNHSVVSGFDCGDGDVNHWIKGIATDTESAVSSITNKQRWCRVWLYTSQPNLTPDTLVGYSSLGMSSWPLSASKNRTLVGTIPYFGVDLKFQGQLHDGAETFAMGIYRDLLAIAEDCLDPSIQFSDCMLTLKTSVGSNFGSLVIFRRFREGRFSKVA